MYARRRHIAGAEPHQMGIDHNEYADATQHIYINQSLLHYD